MKYIGYFSEMNLYEDSGPLSKNIIETVPYDKEKVIKYLLSQKRIASCPKQTIDCGTKEVLQVVFLYILMENMNGVIFYPIILGSII